jgi:hypothetical protein
MHFILNKTTVTDNNFTKLCINLPNGFQCSWPLMGLDTPNKMFCYIEMAVDIHWYEKLQNLINIMNLILKKETPIACHSQSMNTWWYETSCLFYKTGITTGRGALTVVFCVMFIFIDGPFEHFIHYLYTYPCIAITVRGLLYAVNIWSISI